MNFLGKNIELFCENGCDYKAVLFNILSLCISGPEFQTRIRQNEQNNPKFNFLNTGDPYHAYYQHKVKEFKENEGKGKRSNFLRKILMFNCSSGQQCNSSDRVK